MQNGNSGDTSRLVAFLADYDPVAVVAFSAIGFIPLVDLLFGGPISQTSLVASGGYVLLLWAWAAVSYLHRKREP